MMPMINWLLIALESVIAISFIITISAYMAAYFGAMWVPSSLTTTHKMLTLAQLEPSQKVIDLGAGDGRVVILAAQQFGANALGVEIDPLRCLFANGLIMLMGLRRQAWVHYANLFSFDLTDADVVIIYLTRASNARLKARLTEQLRCGTRVVTRFAIPGWTAQIVSDRDLIFLYEIGNTGFEVETRLI